MLKLNMPARFAVPAKRRWVSAAYMMSALMFSSVLTGCSSDSDNTLSRGAVSATSDVEKPPEESATLPNTLRAPTDTTTLDSSQKPET
ncbi:hypothetical protein [Alkalimarinus coralli]|uniref:hypothetical protein n=1 Tax=Alkalimarinus coralli TaxID=2935863 RepID=UPI00202B4986|nr:hypothetical protein [Alkalimarinus coralli]